MGILDDAIREHLELKRQHGAGGDDLQQLENEAFGPATDEELSIAPTASDEAAEAPTQFMSTSPGTAEEAASPPEGAASGDEGHHAVMVPPPEPQAPEPAAEPEATVPSAPPEPAAPPQPAAQPETSEMTPPSPPEQPAMEHDVIPEAATADGEAAAADVEAESAPPEQPLESKGPNTEERHAISQHPTELYDVAAELSAGQESPSAEELYEAEAGEPRLAPPEPVGEPLEVSQPDDSADAGADRTGEDDDVGEPGAEAELAIGDEEDFFDEQTLSDELDQALDAPGFGPPSPAAEEHAFEPEPEPEALPEPESYRPLPSEPATEPEPEPATEPEPEPESEPETDPGLAPAPEPEPEEEETASHPSPPPPPAEPATESEEEEGGFHDQSEDVLEDTPDFLQETPEHDRLWFEQKPPKDFDFDD